MVWIGLHGVMFLFLFSDFYKTKYTRAAQKVKVAANGHVKAAAAASKEHLTDAKPATAATNGNVIYANGGSNKGACMVSLILGSNSSSYGHYKQMHQTNTPWATVEVLQ